MSSFSNLDSLNFDNLGLSSLVNNYNVDYLPYDTIGSVLLKHLTSKIGFIKNSKTNHFASELFNSYSTSFHKLVSKGSPIQFFFLGFSPKFRNPDISNGFLLPDMSDLLTLIHLNLISKKIREVYDYGFQFILGYKGDIYKTIGMWDEKVISDCFENIQILNKYAEKIVGVKNAIKIINTKELFNKEGSYMYKQIEDEIEKLKDEYINLKIPETLSVINKWLLNFDKSIDKSLFRSISELETYKLNQAFLFRSLENVQYIGGEKNLGILNSLPNVLQATFRGVDNKLSLQRNPFFDSHSHQRLTVREQDGSWQLKKWSDFSHLPYEIVYMKELNYPFYFQML